MSYDLIEAGLLTIVRKDSHFSAQNSDRADERILAQGRPVTAILRYGGSDPKRGGANNNLDFTWTTIVDVWFRNQGEIPFYNSNIGEHMNSLLRTFATYPTLAGVADVSSAFPGASGEVLRWQGDRGAYWVCSFPVLVTENFTIAALTS